MLTALDAFLARLRSITQTITLNERLVEFGRVPPGRQNTASASLRHFVRQLGLSGLQPNLDGSVLLVTAAFEQFITDLIVAFAAELPQVVPVYNDLPRALRTANEVQTGEAINRNRGRFTEYALRQFVSNLRDCHSGVQPYVLNGEAIALNDRNLTASTVRALMSRVGIDDVWLLAASTRTLQRWSGPGGRGPAGSRAKNTLNDLIESRNQIAHTVGGATLGPNAILSQVRFCQALGRSLVRVMEQHLRSVTQ